MTKQVGTSYGCFQKIGVGPPNHPHFNRVFHYFHHPFWGNYPLFLVQHPYICSNLLLQFVEGLWTFYHVFFLTRRILKKQQKQRIFPDCSWKIRCCPCKKRWFCSFFAILHIIRLEMGELKKFQDLSVQAWVNSHSQRAHNMYYI